MSGEMSALALNPIGPRQGRIRALACTASSQNIDLTTISETAEAVNGNQIFSLTAEGGDVWYFFGTASSTIDRTNTTQGNSSQADYLPAGASRDVHVPYVKGTGGNSGVAATFLHYQAAVASGVILRVSVSSEALNARV